MFRSCLIFFLFTFLLFSFHSSCFGSITIYNDSPYPLNATILSADGKQLETTHILPQKRFEWKSSNSTNADQSQTPYTVLFECQTGEHFGSYKNVGPGAWVTASNATGGQGVCRKKKNAQRKTRS